MENYRAKIEKIFDLAIAKDATDIHFSEDRQPFIRIDGKLTPLETEAALSNKDIQDLVDIFLPAEKKEKYLKQKDVDLSFGYKEKSRFRINIYQQLGKTSIALRLIPTKVRSIEELNLPSICYDFAKANQGFLLIVGPAGHGKTTACAAIINEINHTRYDHIITIEDPVEYIFTPDKCLIDQREVGADVFSFHHGLKEVLRQDPDVLLIGEMRDPETIASAVTAAETGHLVLATLHTNTASQTIDRIIDSFPPYQQNQIRIQLASTILGVVSRRLVPCVAGGVINAVEVMVANSAIRHLIREGKTYQVDMSIETGSDQGMISLNRSLTELVRKELIAMETAELFSNNVPELRMLLKRM